jgi:hypothetical protein
MQVRARMPLVVLALVPVSGNGVVIDDVHLRYYER